MQSQAFFKTIKLIWNSLKMQAKLLTEVPVHFASWRLWICDGASPAKVFTAPTTSI